MVDTTGERGHEAELHRLQGELLLQAIPEVPAAEACFLRAFDLARHQQARSWELRAAMSLSRLGSARANAFRPVRCWNQFTAGSARASTLPICWTPERCWTPYHETLEKAHAMEHTVVKRLPTIKVKAHSGQIVHAGPRRVPLLSGYCYR